MQAVDPDRPLEAMTREVSAAVTGYRSRLEQIAQAKAAAAALPAVPTDSASTSSSAPPPGAGGQTASAFPAG